MYGNNVPAINCHIKHFGLRRENQIGTLHTYYKLYNRVLLEMFV